jgi:hypothetical protein
VKRIVMFSAVLGLMALASTAPAASGATGVSPYQLGVVAGWTCVVPPPHPVVHCIPPGASLEGPSFITLVFDTNDPTAPEAQLLGTELNLRVDIYNHSARDPGPPCPQDPEGQEYTDLRPLLGGFPYFACHHFNSPL